MRAREVLNDKYAVVRRLGAGPMTEVHEAENLLLGKRVALKVLRPEHNQDADLRQGFLEDARAAARLEHPNIADVLDLGEWSGQAYLVVELLAGQNLQATLRGSSALPLESACDLIVQVLAALEHAHERGIVHGNLHPRNIVIVYPRPGVPWVKVTDFGLRHAHDREPLSRAESAYRAPETHLGVHDERTDVFACAGVLYALLSGEPPPAPETPGLADALLGLNPSVPRELARAIAEALHPDPERRVQTAAELARELAPLALASEPARDPEALYAGSAPSIRWLSEKQSVAPHAQRYSSSGAFANFARRTSAGPTCESPLAFRDSCVTESLLRNPRFLDANGRSWPKRWRALRGSFKHKPNTGAAWVLALASLGAGIACALAAAWLQ